MSDPTSVGDPGRGRDIERMAVAVRCAAAVADLKLWLDVANRLLVSDGRAETVLLPDGTRVEVPEDDGARARLGAGIALRGVIQTLIRCRFTPYDLRALEDLVAGLADVDRRLAPPMFGGEPSPRPRGHRRAALAGAVLAAVWVRRRANQTLDEASAAVARACSDPQMTASGIRALVLRTQKQDQQHSPAGIAALRLAFMRAALEPLKDWAPLEAAHFLEHEIVALYQRR